METKASAAESKADFDLKHTVVLPACITVHQGCARLVPAFKGHKQGPRCPATEVSWLWAAMLVLGMKPGSSGRVTSALNC